MNPPNLRILCVEDDPDICELLRLTLRHHGLEAVCVSEVAAALSLMRKERFRLYILDGQLPGVSGLSLCQEIRSADEVTPIVIFSGHVGESDRKTGMSAGADAYLLKPDLSELVPTVKRLLEGSRRLALTYCYSSQPLPGCTSASATKAISA